MSEENVTISMGPLKMAGAVLSIITAIVAANYFLIVTVVEREIAAHTTVPHPATIVRAKQIAEEVARLDKSGSVGLTAEIGEMQIKQASFGADIVWIKNHQLQTDRKLDRILEELGNSKGRQ